MTISSASRSKNDLTDLTKSY